MRSLIFGLMICLCVSYVRGADFVWWEGESASKTNFTNQAFAPRNLEKPEVLSGKDWLNHAGKRGVVPLFAEYTVEVPAGIGDKALNFWVRKFWKHGPFRWQFDGGAWGECGAEVALADNVEIQHFVCANWVALGEVKLAAGKHSLRIELLGKAGEEATACFDAFLLTPSVFVPRGKLKPGDATGLVEAGFFAWEPENDTFGPTALLNLRGLNEKVAGERGYVVAKGGEFALGEGKPVRFWAVNMGGDFTKLPRGQQEYLAASLAKRGVNMVRIHSSIADPTKANVKVPAEVIADYQRLIGILKAQGIYTELSIYFPVWYDEKPFARIFFDAEFQGRYREIWKQLLTTPDANGKTLAEEPAVGLIEQVNEDSLFFWTFNDKLIPPAKMEMLEKQFAAWAVKRHGSMVKALVAFKSQRHARDAGDRLGLMDAWFMTADGLAKAGKRERTLEQVRFLAETQRAFYANTAKYLRATLKVKCPIVASNWVTADDAVLGAVERWTYDACDVRDRHGYFGGEHKGPTKDWAVAKGDSYKDRAGVLEPEALPLQFVQTPHQPTIISELGWTNPNKFRGENVLLSAATGSVQGADGLFFFAINSFAWSQQFDKFPVSSPAVLGQFPAGALMYRRGDLKAPPAVVKQEMTVEQMWSLQKTGPAAAEALDALRAGDGKRGGEKGTVFDVLTFYTGPVLQSVEKGESSSIAAKSGVDGSKKLIADAGEQLRWNYGSGVVTINTARTQAACGFLGKAGDIQLGDVSITCGNDFASVFVIALDDQPLAQSKLILVQAFTEEHPYGYKVKGGVIQELGGAPMQIGLINASIQLKTSGWSATVLNANGYAVRQIEAKGAIQLPRDAMYTVLKR